MDETELGTREDARSTTDRDDARFVGIRPEVQRILWATDDQIGDVGSETSSRMSRRGWRAQWRSCWTQRQSTGRST